jgi:ketosteroid isomerase-like protein
VFPPPYWQRLTKGDPMSNTQTIQTVYAAFGRGDIPAILSVLAEDVDWNHQHLNSKECPWNGDFSGKANVPKYFATIAEHLDINVFNPHAFLTSGDRVAVLLRIESTIKKNGRKVANDVIHLFTFDTAGQVIRYQQFNDTAQELAAWRG